MYFVCRSDSAFLLRDAGVFLYNIKASVHNIYIKKIKRVQNTTLFSKWSHTNKSMHIHDKDNKCSILEENMDST